MNCFRSIWQKRPVMMMICVSGVLLAAAAVAGVILWLQGDTAGECAASLLAEYEQNTVPPPTRHAVPSPVPSPSEPVPIPIPTPALYEGYEVIGVLIIDNIDVELPVIAATSTRALEVSCCYYQGARPGEDGNMVITGHNYASGAIFGRLKALDAGDTVVLSTPGGDYTYGVYETEVIAPDDTGALDEYRGDRALTLMTCSRQGSRRLLVRCSCIP